MGEADVAGYVVDPAGLENAIKKLEGARDDAGKLVTQASQVKPGELTADDAYTNRARLAIQERAVGEHGSLRFAARELEQKLDEKIESYKAVLREYQQTDEAAADNAGRIDPRA